MFQRLRSIWPWKADAARKRIIEVNAPRGMRVRGLLDLSQEPIESLPENLQAETIQLEDCARLRQLPSGLSCDELILRRSAIEGLPGDLSVTELIDAGDCRNLKEIPSICVDRLRLDGCVRLTAMSNGLVARSVDLTGCYRLEELPAGFGATTRSLLLRDCARLTSLPAGMMRLETLDVRGCRQITSLPDEIRVRSWIDVAGSGLSDLPWSLRSVRILWNGVLIPNRVAFDPESITVGEILNESNVAIRRVLLERVGYEWFVDHADATVLDEDQDPGGTRRLLRISGCVAEDYYFVELHCPSTGDRYLLRVPPDMQSCHQAVAWTAGYTTPGHYQPIRET